MNHSHSEEPTPSPHGPYFDWALATNFRYMRKGEWLPMFIEFRLDAVPTEADDATPLQRFTRLQWFVQEWNNEVRVPDLFAQLPTFLNSDARLNFCVLMVKRDRARDVIADAGWAQTIANVVVGPPVDLPPPKTAALATVTPPPAPEMGVVKCLVDQARKLIGAGTASAKGTAGPVLLGVLDEGIAFAHERFRPGGASLIRYLWSQDSYGGKSLGSFLPGSELTGADIEQAVSDFSLNGRVDEDRLYQEKGSLDFLEDGYKALGRRRAHGTHVLDLAAGAGDASMASPIVAVELPEAMVADPSGSPLYAHILLGVLYVLIRAQQVKADLKLARLPVVINLSYGPQDGPHDGSSSFERFLDLIVDLSQSSTSSTPLTVVLAAGNFRQSRCHAHVDLAAGDAKTLGWRLQPEDLTPSFLEFWLKASAGTIDPVVTVTAPTGATATVSIAKVSDRIAAAKGGDALRVDFVPLGAGVAKVVLTALPTAPDPPWESTQPTAPSGRWTIAIRNDGTQTVTVDGWISRDGAIGGRRARGRQSHFDDDLYQRFDSYGHPVQFDEDIAATSNPSVVVRGGTLSGIATGRHTLVVGGYRRQFREPDMPAPYSSMGPVSGGPRTRKAPTLLAPSDDSLSCRGLLAAGTRSGSVVAMNGTSVAAPVFARWLVRQVRGGATVPIPNPLPGPPLKNPPKAPDHPPTVPAGAKDSIAGDGCLPDSPYLLAGVPRRDERLGRK